MRHSWLNTLLLCWLFRWSAIGRAERYRKRCADAGDEAMVEDDNPLPGFIDPITLEPVANPAISPFGESVKSVLNIGSYVYCCTDLR